MKIKIEPHIICPIGDLLPGACFYEAASNTLHMVVIGPGHKSKEGKINAVSLVNGLVIESDGGYLVSPVSITLEIVTKYSQKEQ